MSPHEARVKAAHPKARAARSGRSGPWSVRLRPGDKGPVATGDTREAAWVNAIRAIDPEDRLPLPNQAELPLED